VVLAAFVRREGIWLAAGVMVVDVVANWGVFVLVTTLPLLRVVQD
jgi:hypothetical protein